MNYIYDKDAYPTRHVIIDSIPMPPSVNHAYPTGSHGRRFKSGEYQKWLKDLQTLSLGAQFKEAREEFSKLNPGYVIQFGCHFFFEKSKVLTAIGTPKRLDVDNRIKILVDGISKVVGFDDKMVFKIIAEKYPTRGRNDCQVILTWYRPSWGL